MPRLFFTALIVAGLLPSGAVGQEKPGNVEPTPQRLEGPARAWDGYTIEIAGYVVRISGIDAPEMRGDARGPVARGAMDDLLAGRQVVCEISGRDRYKRLVGKCRAGGRDLGEAMVRSGWAFEHRKYTADYGAAEAEARAEGRGFWAAPASSVDENFGWENLVNMGAFLSAVTALTVAVLTGLSLREMRRAREESVRPYLVMQPKQERVKVAFESDRGAPNVFFLDEDAEYDENRPPFFLGQPVYVDLQNIGSGLARLIKFTWRFEGVGLSEVVPQTSVFGPLNPEIMESMVTFGTKASSAKDAKRTAIARPGEHRTTLHFCLPHSETPTASSVMVPGLLLHHLALVTLGLCYTRDKEKLKIPYIHVDMEYKSAAGETLGQEANIRFRPSVFPGYAVPAGKKFHVDDLKALYRKGNLAADLVVYISVKLGARHGPSERPGLLKRLFRRST